MSHFPESADVHDRRHGEGAGLMAGDRAFASAAFRGARTGFIETACREPGEGRRPGPRLGGVGATEAGGRTNPEPAS